MDVNVGDWGVMAATTALGALGALWTAFRSSDWLSRMKNERFRKALEALEAGVEQTYRTYVRALKAGREDGKLTDEERRQARALARETAMAFGRTQGIDVLEALGRDYVDLWIAKLVKNFKSEGGASAT